MYEVEFMHASNACTCVRMYACMYVSMNLCMQASMQACMYVRIRTHTHTHTHTLIAMCICMGWFIDRSAMCGAVANLESQQPTSHAHTTQLSCGPCGLQGCAHLQPRLSGLLCYPNSRARLCRSRCGQQVENKRLVEKIDIEKDRKIDR